MKEIFSPDVPVLLIGAPGVGKTARIQSLFDHAEVVLTSTLVEEDIGGLPYREGEYDFRTIPSMFRRLHDAEAEGKTTVLFLDELDKARRSVADTLLTLIASRKVGSAVLPKNTCIAAAANPPEFGGGDGISEAMQSRFSTLDYEPDIAAWCEWASKQFSLPVTKSIINAIGSGEMPIFDMTGEGLEKRISSPRTISMALKTIERLSQSPEIAEKMIRGLLTPAVSSQMMHFVYHQDNEVLTIAIRSAKRSNVKLNSVQPVRL